VIGYIDQYIFSLTEPFYAQVINSLKKWLVLRKSHLCKGFIILGKSKDLAAIPYTYTTHYFKTNMIQSHLLQTECLVRFGWAEGGNLWSFLYIHYLTDLVEQGTVQVNGMCSERRTE